MRADVVGGELKRRARVGGTNGAKSVLRKIELEAEIRQAENENEEIKLGRKHSVGCQPLTLIDMRTSDQKMRYKGSIF